MLSGVPACHRYLGNASPPPVHTFSFPLHSPGSSPSLTLEAEILSSGLGLLWAGREPSKHPGLAAEKRCITRKREFDWGGEGKSVWPGELSHSHLLAGCLKLHQLQTKRVFRHKGRLNLTSARPGMAFEFRNPGPGSSQTGQIILELSCPCSSTAKNLR